MWTHRTMAEQLPPPPPRGPGEGRLEAEALDAMSVGILVVGADGRVLHANAAAHALADAGDGLSLGGWRSTVAAARADETRALHRLVAEVAAAPGRGVGAMAVSRPSGRRPYAVLAAPLSAPSSSAAVLFVTDLDSRPPLSERNVAQLLGLTTAEARLACALVQGLDLKAAAAQLRISINTVRTHLRQIFAKTGTRRQSELVALILRLAVLSDPGPAGAPFASARPRRLHG